MPKVQKLVCTLTLGAALTGGMVGLGAATTMTTAHAASTITMSGSGEHRDWTRNRGYNRNWHRARNWNRSPARSWARNVARHLNRSLSLSRSANRQAQAINIRLVFPNTSGAPVSASATSTVPTPRT